MVLLNIYEIKMTQVKEEEAVSPAKPIKPKTAVLSVEKQKSQPKRVSIQIYLTNNKKTTKFTKVWRINITGLLFLFLY